MGEGENTEWPDDDADPFGTPESETVPKEEAVQASEASEVSEEESQPESSAEGDPNLPTDEAPLVAPEHNEWELPSGPPHFSANSMVKQLLNTLFSKQLMGEKRRPSS